MQAQAGCTEYNAVRRRSIDLYFRRKYLKGLLSIPCDGRGARRPQGQSFRKSVGPAALYRCPPLIAVTYSFGGHMSRLCERPRYAVFRSKTSISAQARSICIYNVSKSPNSPSSRLCLRLPYSWSGSRIRGNNNVTPYNPPLPDALALKNSFGSAFGMRALYCFQPLQRSSAAALTLRFLTVSSLPRRAGVRTDSFLPNPNSALACSNSSVHLLIALQRLVGSVGCKASSTGTTTE